MLSMKVADLTVEEFEAIIRRVVEESLAGLFEEMAAALSDENGELSEEFLQELEAAIMEEEEEMVSGPRPVTDELTRRRRKRK